HRLNVFGFLYLAELAGSAYADSGNVGMMDCVAALEWVRDNIAAFGGDPGNVTIFGQSGGASNVALRMAAPSAHGLFHSALIESAASLLGMVMPERATAVAKALCDDLGVSADRLPEAPVSALLEARQQVISKAGGADSWRPAMDGRFLTVHPFDPQAPSLSKQ